MYGCDETVTYMLYSYMRVALASKRKKTTGSKASPEKTAAEKALSNYLIVLLVLGKRNFVECMEQLSLSNFPIIHVFCIDLCGEDEL